MTGHTQTSKWVDPFDIPTEVIPVGISYQWVDWDTIADFERRGWRKVPIKRHVGLATEKGWEEDSDGGVKIGLCSLMETSAEATKEALERNEDSALINSGSPKTVDLWVEVRLRPHELSLARTLGLASSTWAKRRLEQVARGKDCSGVVLAPDGDPDYGWTGMWQFSRVPKAKPGWGWLWAKITDMGE